MRIFVAIVINLVEGFIAGIVLSDVIGIVGFTLFDRLVGIKFLPFYCAVVCAIVVPIVDQRRSK